VGCCGLLHGLAWWWVMLIVTQPHHGATVAVSNAVATVGVGIEVGLVGDRRWRLGMGGSCGIVAWFGVVVGGAGMRPHRRATVAVSNVATTVGVAATGNSG